MFSFPFSTKGLTMVNSGDGARRGGRMPLNMVKAKCWAQLPTLTKEESRRGSCLVT